MKLLYILVLLLGLTYAEFERFNFNQDVVARGTVYVNTTIYYPQNNTEGPVISVYNEPIIYVLDGPNQRMFLGSDGTGFRWVLPNGTFIILFGNSFKRTDFTYADQIKNYKFAFSTDNKDQKFMGKVLDSDSCQEKIAVDIEIKRYRNRSEKILQKTFQQYFPVSAPNISPYCTLTNAIIEFDDDFDSTSRRDSFFVLPPQFYAENIHLVPNYCDFIYPTPNACGI